MELIHCLLFDMQQHISHLSYKHDWGKLLFYFHVSWKWKIMKSKLLLPFESAAIVYRVIFIATFIELFLMWGQTICKEFAMLPFIKLQAHKPWINELMWAFVPVHIVQWFKYYIHFRLLRSSGCTATFYKCISMAHRTINLFANRTNCSQRHFN